MTRPPILSANVSPSPCWRALVSECEPIVIEREPNRGFIVAECEPENRYVCEPDARCLRAATVIDVDSRNMLLELSSL